MDAGTPRFSYFSTLFTVHLFRQWIPSLERLTFASPTCNPQPRIHGLQIIGVFPSRVAATVHSLRASAPGPGDTSKEVLSSPGGATAASRGRALLSPRFGLGTGKGKGRLGTSWGLRPQAMNFRRYAAGENTDDLQPVNPQLWVACGRCECKPP